MPARLMDCSSMMRTRIATTPVWQGRGFFAILFAGLFAVRAASSQGGEHGARPVRRRRRWASVSSPWLRPCREAKGPDWPAAFARAEVGSARSNEAK